MRRGLVVLFYVVVAGVFGFISSMNYRISAGWLAVVIRVVAILLTAWCVIRAVRAARGAKRFQGPDKDAT